jgi:hypothetical protein
MSKAKSIALKVKHKGSNAKFERSYKVLQGDARKHGDKVVFLKRPKKSSGKVNPADIPF